VKEKAVVVRIEDADAVLAVTPADQHRCGSCGACGSGERRRELRVKDTEALRAGDTVTLEVTHPSVILSAVLVFVMPIVGAFIAWLLASLFFDAGWIKGVAAAAGFVSSFVIAGLYDRLWRARHGDSVRIVDVHRQNEDQSSAIQADTARN